ncbi:hypothetical protein J6TS2_13550 [Heyndrickxia sporothermodurans]|nr:hypothetical protein J6TS2_13550 [Heyndrickxia sporothermodurans]
MLPYIFEDRLVNVHMEDKEYNKRMEVLKNGRSSFIGYIEINVYLLSLD